MHTPEHKDLGKMSGALAQDVISTQMRFDERYEQQLAEWANQWEKAGLRFPDDPPNELLRLLRLASAPQRSQIESFEVDCRLSIEIERRQGYSIEAVPLNLSYDVRTRRSRTNDSRLQLFVEAVPLPPNISIPTEQQKP